MNVHVCKTVYVYVYSDLYSTKNLLKINTAGFCERGQPRLDDSFD